MDVVYLDAHLDLQQLDTFKIEKLQNCRSIDEIKALESPHYLNPSEAYCYGIENFLYPAARLGILKHLYWVAPPHIPRSYSESMLRHTQKMDGVDFAALTGFRQVGKSAMKGNLLGIDITICHYDDLPNLGVSKDYILDIDIDYFVSVPADLIWIDPGKVLNSILNDLGNPILSTVSHAVTSGFTPTTARFIGQYAKSVLQGSNTDVEHYHRLYSASVLAQEGNKREAIELAQRLVETRPECSATQFLNALLATDRDSQNQYFERAVNLDPIYNHSVLRDASAVPNRFKPFSKTKMNTIVERFNKLPTESPQYEATQTAVGLLLAKAGRLKESLSILQSLEKEYEGHFDMAMALGIILSETPNLDIAERLLKRASERDKNRTESCFYLGEIAIKKNKLTDAIAHMKQAHDRAPAWEEPLKRLGACYLRVGDLDKKREIDEELRHRSEQLHSLTKGQQSL